MDDQARRSKRYPISRGLALKCDSWADFVQFYASDISQGGLFIVTEEALPIMSVVEVRLDLPEGHQIPLKARVVHVVDRSTAQAQGKEVGVGLEFIDLDGDRKAHIVQLIEFARWEGASGTGTFASHMFERSATFQTLDEVVQSLPPAQRTRSGAPHGSSARPSNPSASGAVRKKRRRRRSDEARRTGEFAKGELHDGSASGAADAKKAPRPSDPIKLKEAMTHFAHRRYDEAIADFRKMDEDNPGDVEANKWMLIAQARLALADKNEVAANTCYERALELDETNHEARRFVRDYHRKRKLKAIPFGRYFARRSED